MQIQTVEEEEQLFAVTWKKNNARGICCLLTFSLMPECFQSIPVEALRFECVWWRPRIFCASPSSSSFSHSLSLHLSLSVCSVSFHLVVAMALVGEEPATTGIWAHRAALIRRGLVPCAATACERSVSVCVSVSFCVCAAAVCVWRSVSLALFCVFLWMYWTWVERIPFS